LKDELIYKSKTKYLIPAFNRETGEIDYLQIEKNVNIFEAMRATKAMPIAFKMNPKIKIGTSIYCDSPISGRAESHIKKAIDLGANKILIIDSISNQKNLLINFFFFLWMFFQKCKSRYYQTKQKLLNYQSPKNIKTFTISPKSELKITTLNNKEELLQQSFEQGYQETVSNSELISLLKRLLK
jgi:predicted patatin/cPLA2 family phospholipase